MNEQANDHDSLIEMASDFKHFYKDFEEVSVTVANLDKQVSEVRAEVESLKGLVRRGNGTDQTYIRKHAFHIILVVLFALQSGAIAVDWSKAPKILEAAAAIQ